MSSECIEYFLDAVPNFVKEAILMSYMEWILVVFTVIFFWWKYGRIMESIKIRNGLRQLTKKLEAIILSSETECIDNTRKWDEKHYMSLPNTRSHFNTKTKRSKCRDPNTIAFNVSPLPAKSCNRDKNDNVTPCSLCTHPSKDEILQEIKDSVVLKNCLDCDTRDAHNPWYIRRFAFFVFFWRKWFIGPQYHMVSLKDMMSDERLNEAVEEAARLELKDNPNAGPLESLIVKHKQRAERIVKDMRAIQPKHPYFALFVRIASWIIGKTLRRIYPQILVRRRQIETLRKARASGYPILYLPIHRSHIDYVLVSWALVACDMRAPLVAAGQNLNIPIFSLMMKSVGGFFIKRRLDRKDGKKDIVYRAILHSYMTRSLVDDNDLEFFIEGGRTRTGKPCLPKGGLLSIVVDALIKNKVEDILVVPVNFSYEKLLEGNYIREQLGQPKVTESFATAAMGLWNSCQTKFGNARVDFGHPFSMREFIQSHQISRSPSPSCSMSSDNSDSDSNNSKTSSCSIAVESQRELINDLATHVIYDGVKCFSLMSTNAVTFILLSKYRNGVTEEKLVEEMKTLKVEMLLRGHDVGFSGDMSEVIQHGLTVLGPGLIRKEIQKKNSDLCEDETPVTILKPVTMLPNIIDLSYYSTCVLPIYAMESTIATSLFVLCNGALKQPYQSDKTITLKKSDLLSTCVELCEILYHEFIFTPPCQTLEDSINNSISFMLSQGVLTETPDSSIESCTFFGDTIDSDAMISVHLNQKNYEQLVFLKNLLIPILDTYVVSSQVLKRLVGHETQEKQLQMSMLSEIKSQLQLNIIDYGESLALDPIRNFIKLVLGWHVLESFTKDNIVIYYLQDSFDNEKSMNIVTKRIERFRILHKM